MSHWTARLDSRNSFDSICCRPYSGDRKLPNAVSMLNSSQVLVLSPPNFGDQQDKIAKDKHRSMKRHVLT